LEKLAARVFFVFPKACSARCAGVLCKAKIRQHKSKQKKSDPAVCVPKQSFGQFAVLVAGGCTLELATLKQSRALIHLPLRSSAHTEGAQHRQLVAHSATLQTVSSSNDFGKRCNARQRRASSAVQGAVVRRRVAQGWADQGSRLFEAKPSSSETPPGPSNAAYRHTVPGDAFGSFFLCLLSFDEAKESKCAVGRISRPACAAKAREIKKTQRHSPAAAIPGQRSQQKQQKKG
jgi:hypothetical protein